MSLHSKEQAIGSTRDDAKNLIVCPLPYDGSFMQTIYEAWKVVVQFLSKGDARVPANVFLPRPASRPVAGYLEDPRDFPVMQVIEALEPLSQPEPLETQRESASAPVLSAAASTATTSSVLAPIPRST